MSGPLFDILRKVTTATIGMMLFELFCMTRLRIGDRLKE
jgi:hypothetical protein